MGTALAIFALVGALAAVVWALTSLRRRGRIATETQRATYQVLHAAGLAAESLRSGLTATSAAKAARHLRPLVGSLGLALVDDGSQLALDGDGGHHGSQLAAASRRAIEGGRPAVLRAEELACDRLDCAVRGAVVVPVSATGALIAITEDRPAPGLVQAALETGRWVSAQISLAELDASRERLARAEVRALRAQISPHFIYNALTAIASFVRTDPDRARTLLEEFAEFTRYSFRAHGEFTTLAEELRSIDRYLTIERARYGDRLQVRLRIAPEVLPVTLPFLCLQPLVENAVRHGLSPKPGVGNLHIDAEDAGSECHITVEDDGVGMDPEVIGPSRAAPDIDGQHVGLANVDERLRAAFGDQFGLVVETGIGAGTRVSVRIPKFHPGVRVG
jgi:two-component system LytT family sensor kinase